MMRFLAAFACSALTLLGGCILVYDPGGFTIAEGGNGGEGGAGGGQGGGSACSPQDMLNGDPVVAPMNQWTWVPVQGATCRDGSSTGFGVRINPSSTKLMIFFEGEGACFNAASCMENASSFGSASFDTLKSTNGDIGIFDTSNPDNPIRDWNVVLIPYCTGDFHAGNNTADVPGGGPMSQSFFGFANVGRYMARIVPTFPGLTEVLVAGISAGGSGAVYNYDRIARDLCPVPVVLIADSGPTMSDGYLTPCLQMRLRALWGVNATLPKDCPEAIGPEGGGIVNLITCIGDKYKTGHLGMVAADKDAEIAAFYGFGQSNCANLDGVASPLPSATYSAGLSELRSAYMHDSAAWGSYFVNSASHGYVVGGSFYTTTVNGVSLTSWVKNMVNGGAVTDVGP